jgi:probable F420-dependent oxidoreductase
MQIGLSVYDTGPRDLVELARAADELGFGSLWLGEHVVLPVAYASAHPTAGPEPARPIVDPSTRLVDPLVALAGCAAVTRRILLATGIFLAPLRPPLVAARMAHTLQELSCGRFVLGVGSGWLQEEYAALDVPFEHRGRRLAETVDVMRKAWAGGPFSHCGEFFRFEQVQLCDAALDIPVIMGGNSEPALRRAARLGDGWFASGTPDPDDACRLRDSLHGQLARFGRRGAFPVYARVKAADGALIDRYRRSGWDHVLVWADQVWPAGAPLEDKRARLAAVAASLGLQSARVPSRL